MEGREGNQSYFATAGQPCPTCCATYYLNDRIGPDDPQRFCSRRVSHRAARCERIVGSEESSITRDQAMVSEGQSAEKAHQLCNPSKLFRNPTNSDPGAPPAISLMLSLLSAVHT